MPATKSLHQCHGCNPEILKCKINHGAGGGVGNPVIINYLERYPYQKQINHVDEGCRLQGSDIDNSMIAVAICS